MVQFAFFHVAYVESILAGLALTYTVPRNRPKAHLNLETRKCCRRDANLARLILSCRLLRFRLHEDRQKYSQHA